MPRQLQQLVSFPRTVGIGSIHWPTLSPTQVDMRRTISLLVFLLISLVARSASAQTADIIRGRVTGPDSQPIVNAAILVTSLQGGISKQSKTDKNGRFSVVYPNGEGDYWVVVAAIGFTQKRFEVKRIADEEVLLADTKLAPATLERVEVVAQGARRTAARNDNTVDASGTSRGVGNGSVAAADAGNLAALAASLPGFQLIPGLDGNPDLFSALGLGPEQNNAMLNGAPSNGMDLPRDAATSSSIGTSSWDVSSGGFSGAQISTRTLPGNNYKTRSMSFQGDTPHLQWSDNVGDALSAERTRLSPGGRFSGPLRLDKDFYNVSAQFDHLSRDVQNLFNTDPLGLNAGGVSPDSAARLRNVLQDLGIPVAARDIPGGQSINQLRLQSVFDFSPRSPTSGHSFQIAANGNWQQQDPTSTSALMSTPTVNGKVTRSAALATIRHTNFFWDKIATETWLTAQYSKQSNEAYLRFPAGNVRVASTLDDGSSSIRSLTFGGRSSQEESNSSSLIGIKNQMRWLSMDNKHSLKLTTEARHETQSSERFFNQLGSFSFLSLEDLAAGRASSYSRNLNPTSEEAGQVSGAVSLVDSWRPSTTFQVQWGGRIDANKFLTRPDFNPAVQEAFGVRNDIVPNRLYPSAAAGFTWTYGTAPQIPFQQGFVTGPRAILRAGVRVLQNVQGPGLIQSQMAATGLPGSSLTLICTGPVTPFADWETYRTNPGAAPTECADGSSQFATSLPSVNMFDKDFKQSTSVRPTVSWSGAVLGNRFRGSFEGTYSYNFHQVGVVDLNLDPTERFSLDNEGNRPVFVPATAIDPGTGSIASRASRRSTDFNSVNSAVSDLSSQSSQITIGLSPLTLNETRFTWSTSYTLQYVREKFNGFSSTAGNPFDQSSSVSQGPRHQIQYSLSYNFWDYVSVYYRGSFSSGMRFTPTVAGDINGDGRGFNDRAFVFDPASASDAVVAADLQSLLSSGSSAAQDCLRSQIGRLASRNSCVGPWQPSNNFLSISIQPIKLKLPPRATINFSVQNPLGAADLLLNGADHLKGWGSPRFPDASLLFVRGFDQATQQYKYEVNRRFGATSAQQSTIRSPVVITASISLDIGPTRDWQGLKMQLDRGRKTTGTRVTEAQLKQVVSNAVPNPMARILQTADILGLSRKQADSLAMLSRGFTLTLDSIWTPVAKYFGGMDSTYSASDAHERFERGREAAANYLIKVAPMVKKLLTKSQLRRLSSGITNLLEPRYLERVRAGAVSSGIGIPFIF
jgi:hypothetical protein